MSVLTADEYFEMCLEPSITQKHQFWTLIYLMQIENDIASKIKAQREKLPEIMEPDFGIRRKLISSGGLSHSENEQIEAEARRSGRSKMLLDFILANGKHQEFIGALRDSGQIHVVNWIMGRGVYRTEYGSDWPLDDREINVIDRNFDKLSSNLITAHGFVEKLHSNGIINCHEMEVLKNEIKNSFKHSEDFLSILRRFSRRSFSLTLECLRQLNQDHAAKLPEEGEDYNSDNDFHLPLEHGYRKIES